MGKKIVTILSGIGLLIFAFLVIRNGTKSAQIINAIGTNSIKGIATLQGQYVPK